MRAVPALLLLAAAGCGAKEPPAPPAPPAPATVVKSWKPHTAGALQFTATFPLGDPTVRPVFFGNQPAGVAEGLDYSAPVHAQDGGTDTYLFGIRAARFRAKATPADREATLAILTAKLHADGWTKTEPRPVTWADRPATETTATDPAKPTKLTVRVLTTDSAVYVGYVRDLGALTPAETARFFDGFQVTAK